MSENAENPHEHISYCRTYTGEDCNCPDDPMAARLDYLMDEADAEGKTLLDHLGAPASPAPGWSIATIAVPERYVMRLHEVAGAVCSIESGAASATLSASDRPGTTEAALVRIAAVAIRALADLRDGTAA